LPSSSAWGIIQVNKILVGRVNLFTWTDTEIFLCNMRAFAIVIFLFQFLLASQNIPVMPLQSPKPLA